MSDAKYCTNKPCDTCPNLDQHTNFCPFDKDKVDAKQEEVIGQFAAYDQNAGTTIILPRLVRRITETT